MGNECELQYIMDRMGSVISVSNMTKKDENIETTEVLHYIEFYDLSENEIFRTMEMIKSS